MRRQGDDSSPVTIIQLPATQLSYQECDLAPYIAYAATLTARMSDGVLMAASETFTTGEFRVKSLKML